MMIIFYFLFLFLTFSTTQKKKMFFSKITKSIPTRLLQEFVLLFFFGSHLFCERVKRKLLYKAIYMWRQNKKSRYEEPPCVYFVTTISVYFIF